MPKRISTTPKLDVVQNARRVFTECIQASDSITLSMVSQVMAEMGRKGGKIGGKRRLKTMTPEARSAVASLAAKARWAKRRKKKAA
jgi:hypothetical protein